MDGEGQSCEGERGSWRTTQSQNRVEQLTGLLPIGLGPEKDSVLTLGSKVSSWKEESQHGHHWWGGPRRWYEKVLGAPDPQLACPLPPPLWNPVSSFRSSSSHNRLVSPTSCGKARGHRDSSLTHQRLSTHPIGFIPPTLPESGPTKSFPDGSLTKDQK